MQAQRQKSDEVTRLMNTMSDNVIKILGGLLQKKYPDFGEKSSIPLMDLLEWDLWPGFITIYGLYLLTFGHYIN